MAYALRTASSSDTDQQKLTLARQRDKLDTAIISFAKAARSHLPMPFLLGELSLTTDRTPEGREWDNIPTSVDDSLTPGSGDRDLT